MGKVAIKQVSGAIYYLPNSMPKLPKSTLVTLCIADAANSIGYCVIVNDANEKDSTNGIYIKSAGFAHTLMNCIDYGEKVFHYNQYRYRILTYDDRPYKKYLQQIEKRTQINKDRLLDYLISERGIKYLYHFTPYENLSGIAKYGIVPRTMLAEDAHALCLDSSRYDNCLDFSCFSLSFPNYEMLFSRRDKYPEQRFAILEIDINILRKIPYDRMLFFYTNASNSIFKYVQALTFQGIDAAKKMFNEDICGIKRADDMPADYTTDSQAEVMIGDVIPIDSITALYFSRHDFKADDKIRLPSVFSERAYWNQRLFEDRAY